MDDQNNTYIQWRDDYLTQVDADFDQFQKANEYAKQTRLAEVNKMSANSQRAADGSSADTASSDNGNDDAHYLPQRPKLSPGPKGHSGQKTESGDSSELPLNNDQNTQEEEDAP